MLFISSCLFSKLVKSQSSKEGVQTSLSHTTSMSYWFTSLKILEMQMQMQVQMKCRLKCKYKCKCRRKMGPIWNRHNGFIRHVWGSPGWNLWKILLAARYLTLPLPLIIIIRTITMMMTTMMTTMLSCFFLSLFFPSYNSRLYYLALYICCIFGAPNIFSSMHLNLKIKYPKHISNNLSETLCAFLFIFPLRI